MVLRVPVGTCVDEVLRFAGGPTIADYKVVDGGPMMGRVLPATAQPVTKTTSGLLVLPPDHTVVARKIMDERTVRRLTNTVCCQCSLCTDLCPRNLLGHSLHPHKIMRVPAGAAAAEAPAAKEALLCSECGVCEKFACPLGLSPREVNAQLKRELGKAGVVWRYDGRPLHPSRFRAERRIPTSRLVQRLGLADYEAHPPFAGDYEPTEVRIPLRQHIGAPAIPVVRVGQQVREGDLVGEIPEGAMGARVHASINGTVRAVDNGCITIRA
jgi:Na+-translocating ferredoxin:NAD+ oxidoreductase RnfC subunit